MSIEEDKDIVRRFINDVVNGEHPERVGDYAQSDFVLYFPGEPAWKREEIPRFQSNLRAAFPDFRVEIEDLIAEGDKVVVLCTITGTHRGLYQGPALYHGYAPTGRAFKLRGLILYRLRDGKLVEGRPIFDRVDMFEQLGLRELEQAA